jgi:hypothetical protein
MDCIDAAEDAVAHELARDAKFLRRALLRADLENAVGFADRFHQLDAPRGRCA